MKKHYPKPSVTVDCVIFGLQSNILKVLLIKRKSEPFLDYWALPGGFVDINEELETAAHRILADETGVKNVFIEQLFTFGNLQRDPRGRVISVAYYALVNLTDHPIKSTEAGDAAWLPTSEIRNLAFDHQAIFETAITRLRGKVTYQPIGFELLPEQFTLSQLRNLYETILDVRFNKRNFRSKIFKMNILKECGKQQNVAHRPATLYKFDKEKYKVLLEEGFLFEIRGMIQEV